MEGAALRAPDRRRWLQQALAAFGALPSLPVLAALSAGDPLRLALAWDETPAEPGADRTRCVGVWAVSAERTSVLTRMVVPTRAHGLARLPSGELLAVARRPGLWMRRWAVDGTLRHEAWAEPGRNFNGHVLPSADGRVLYSTEQMHEDGAGVIALRDPLTLALRDEWPTGGTDPHQMLLVGDKLYVANGGVPTRPETGRAKQALPTMDSSLVAFDVRSGKRMGAWHVDDARLSLRHLAWHASSNTLGIALQAEHDDPAQRARAPLLALFDGQALRTVAPAIDRPDAGAGYAGDIAATADGFMLSASRAGALQAWSARAGWGSPVPLAEACALAARPSADMPVALGVNGAWAGIEGPAWALPAGCKPDNHALMLVS